MAIDGHIHWSQIDSGDKLGTGAKGQSTDGTFTLGTTPKYASDGKLIDSGLPPIPPYIQPATTVPTAASLTKLNQSTGSISDTAAGLYLHQPVGSTTLAFAAIQAAPAAPWTFTAGLILPVHPNNFMHMGICCSDGTKIVTFGPQYNSGLAYAIRKLNSATSFNGDYAPIPSAIPVMMAPLLWLQIQDDNTTLRNCSCSYDGVNFIPLLSVSRTDFLTVSFVGIFSMINGAPVDGNVTCSSWKVTSP